MASPKKGPVRGPPKGFSLTPLYNSAPSGLFVECEITDRHVAITAENTKTIYRNHVGTKSASAYKRMCDILVPLTANAQRIGTEEERKLLDQSIQLCQRLLIEVTLSEATKLVGRAEYEDALPGSIQALRFSLEIYGSGRSELIPCYILLAEANLGLSRFKQAEECLCNANWILIKTRDNDKKVKSILYRGFGRLYAAQGKREEALRQLANDVYYSSLRVGPEHVDTSGGYFYMARVFQDMGKIDCALSLSDKVVDIWYRHLRDIAIAAAEAEERGDSGTKELDDDQAIAGADALQKILQMRESHLGLTHIAVGECFYVISILLQQVGDIDGAIQNAEKALPIYESQLGEDNESTVEVAESLAALRGSRE